MFSYYHVQNTRGLTDNAKAAAVNLAFILELQDYDEKLLFKISQVLTNEEKTALYYFWINLTETTARAALCLREFERKI